MKKPIKGEGGQALLGTLLAAVIVVILVVAVLPVIGNLNRDVGIQTALSRLASASSPVLIGDDLIVSGDLLPGADNTYKIGATGLEWTELHIEGGSIYLGDVLLEDESGCLGVPDLHVHGDEGTGRAGYLKMSAGTAPTHFDANHMSLWLDSSYRLQLQDSSGISTEVVRLDSNGRLGIGTETPSARLEVNGFAMLGSDAPKIKTKKLTGTSPAGGASATIAHGLDKSKIIGAQVLVSNNTGNRIPPNFTSVGSHEFDFFIDTSNVYIYCISGNSASIDNNAFTVLLTYEE